jgi:serine/threonine-protein kinase
MDVTIPQSSDGMRARELPGALVNALADRYRIERELGAGGMATVYLAHDLRHDRDVAMKVLHPELGAVLGAERFMTEIKTTARLQHPHILPLLDSGEAGGLLYYVMPLVTGETLRARIERERQLPLADTLRIAREVADALGAAHALGIIHRDIKPENILLQGGHALVADFGIALAVQSAGGARMTQTGLSLGTPQYMSPEQAMGERVIDARADIYALGAITYEMLTGDPPFTGNSVQAIVAKVMSERPVAPRVLRDTVPLRVETAVMRALAKLPADRPASAAAFTDLLASDTQTESYDAPDAPRVAVASSPTHMRTLRLWQGAAVLALIVAAAAVARAWRAPAASNDGIVRFTLPAANTLVGRTTQPSVSPDGRIIAFADLAKSGGIWLRWIDREEAEKLAGSEDAGDLSFSPDGKSIAFITEAGDVRIVGVDGRSATTLAKGGSSTSGVTWGADGYVYFGADTTGGPIRRVAVEGGTVEEVARTEPARAKPNGDGWLANPLVLDGGKVLLACITGAGRSDGEIVAFEVGTGTRTHVGVGLQPVAWHDGWLLISRADGSLVAQRFDPSSRTASGTPVTMLSGVYTQDGRAFIASSASGTLIYQPAASAVSHLVWMSRDGRETEVDTALARPFVQVALSPTGDRVAVAADELGTSTAVWVYDLTRHTYSRLTPSGRYAFRPRWTPDGQHLLYSADRGDSAGVRNIWSTTVDGRDSTRLVVASSRHAQEAMWSAGSPYIVYRDGFFDGTTRRDIGYVSPTDTTRHVLVSTTADEYNPEVSPDGKWLAYTSWEGGIREVYVMPFPGGGTRHQVSNAGGRNPSWKGDGRELYYRNAAGMLMAADFDGSRSNPVGALHPLFDVSRYSFDENGKSYDNTAAGDRFLFIKPPPRASVSVVVNWWSEAAVRLAKAKR